MNPVTEPTPDFVAMGIYLVGVLVIVGVMLGLSYVLGQRHQERATGEAYESGILITGPARLRFSARFYLVAMLFVIFDLEAALIFAWAVAAKDLGLAGYLGLVVFVAILVAGLIYEWKMGALDWISKEMRISRAVKKPTAGEHSSFMQGKKKEKSHAPVK